MWKPTKSLKVVPSINIRMTRRYIVICLILIIASIISISLELWDINKTNRSGTLISAAANPITLKQLLILNMHNQSSVQRSLPMMYGYTTYTYTNEFNMSMTYYLYVPKNQVAGEKYPLVLLLHGSGEFADPRRTPAQNQDMLLKQYYAQVWTSDLVQAQYPAYIVIPQATTPNRWVNVPGGTGSYLMATMPSDPLLMAKEIVDMLQKDYSNIDSQRLYVTGLSMGGYGTWEAAERWPDYFAAAVPLAGAGDPTKGARLAQLPIWAFYGALDTTVPISGTQDMLYAIEQAGGYPLSTIFPDRAHGVWGPGQSYTSPLFNWLFTQRKNSS